MDLPSVWCLSIVVDQPHNGCIICKFDDGVGAMGGDAVMGVQCVQGWTQNTALRNTSAKDDSGGCGGAHPDMLGSVSQEVLDPQTEGGSKLQLVQFVDESAGADGVKCRAEVNK